MPPRKRLSNDPSLSTMHDNTGIYWCDMDQNIYTGQAKVAGKVEYKHGNQRFVDLTDFQMRGFLDDANGRVKPVPAFIVFYYHVNADGKLINDTDYDRTDSQSVMKLIKHRQYYVVSANDEAKKILNSPTMLSEHDWLSIEVALSGNTLRGVHGKTIIDWDAPTVVGL